MGLVMVFKSSKFINFAHGSMAGLSDFVDYYLTAGELVWPWTAGLLVALATAMTIGSIAHIAIAPLLSNSNSLQDTGTTATIATLGLKTGCSTRDSIELYASIPFRSANPVSVIASRLATRSRATRPI